MQDAEKNIENNPIDKHEVDHTALLNAVKIYEERIKEIEGSVYWKAYLFFTKTKLILTSDSYLKSDKWRFFQRIRFLFSRPGLLLIKKFSLQLFNLIFGKVNRIIGIKPSENNQDYTLYKEKKFPRISDLKAMRENIINFSKSPSLELYVRVDNDNFKHLNVFLNALEKQIYTKFNVCFLVNDNSNLIHYTLNKVISRDEKYRAMALADLNTNSNSILGEYIIFTDLACVLAPSCLYEYINSINGVKLVDFIYSDNDFIYPLTETTDQTENPYFKPNWSPHTILSRNYIGNTFLVSKTLWKTIDSILVQNVYGLILQLSNRAKKVHHIAKILYHEFPESINFKKILNNHSALDAYLKSKNPTAFAKLSEESLGSFEPHFPLKENDLISIIIPCRNKANILDSCLRSVFEKSSYKHFEIIIIDNGSTEKSFSSTVAQWEFNYPEKIRCLRLDIPFNYSILNNTAVKYANGEYLLFLNNDTELISENLLEELLKIAQLDNVGVVGPKLLYPNDTLQHVGIVLSVDESGTHVYSGSHKDTAGYFNNTNCVTNYAAMTGACMMVKKERFEAIGGFDEHLAIDCNDVELCCRLISHGYFNVYVPWVKMYHYECLTRGNPILSKKSMANQNLEKNYFIEKWSDIINDDPFYNINLSRTSKYFEIGNE